MTAKEMTEIFSVMMLAWPNAEMFRGGIQKLGPTIKLWTACLADVDFWIGQQAVIKLCNECKFPPSIAEFREKARSAQTDLEDKIDWWWREVKWELEKHGSTEAAYATLPDGCFAKQAITQMGGPKALVVQSMHLYGDGRREPYEHYNFDGFKEAAITILRSKPVLGDNRHLALSEGERRKRQ